MESDDESKRIKVPGTVALGSITGGLFVFVICAWAVRFLSRQLLAILKSGIAADQTLSEVDKDDALRMFWLQIVGFVLLLGTSALFGIAALVALLQPFHPG